MRILLQYNMRHFGLDSSLQWWFFQRCGVVRPLIQAGAALRRGFTPALFATEVVMHPDLNGIDFDWLARDVDGNIALFATAGEGFFPGPVATHHASHSAITEAIPSPNTGTPNVWSDYAAAGLYVFDWDLPGGPYKLCATPIKRASSELIADVEAVPQLPRFNGRFASLKDLSEWQSRSSIHCSGPTPASLAGPLNPNMMSCHEAP